MPEKTGRCILAGASRNSSAAPWGDLNRRANMKKSVVNALCCIGLLVGLTSLASAADKAWTGQISDSNCGASHAKMIASHTGSKLTATDCTAACIKAGAKYV